MNNSMDISQYREKPSAPERIRKMPSENDLSTNGDQRDIRGRKDATSCFVTNLRYCLASLAQLMPHDSATKAKM
jgi:hypothetical protein